MSLKLRYREFYKKIAVGFRVDILLDPLVSLQHVMQSVQEAVVVSARRAGVPRAGRRSAQACLRSGGISGARSINRTDNAQSCRTQPSEKR